MTEKRVAAFWLAGQPPRKSNDRRILRVKGQPILAKSEKALAWVASAGMQLPPSVKGLQLGERKKGAPVEAWFFVFYSSHRPDLSTELVLDALQDYGVLHDDRWVWVVHAFKLQDKEKPGVFVVLREIDPKTPSLIWRIMQEVDPLRLEWELTLAGGAQEEEKWP